MKKVLAIDMGATSIRGILAWVEDGRLKTREVMRMSHEMISEKTGLCWEWEKLLSAVEKTILEYADVITSVGIDTWGVDFGMIDSDGELIEHPHTYRDPLHLKAFNEFNDLMSKEDVYLKTGNQVMSINTLYQLYGIKKNNLENFKKCKKILMMPDLFQYYLTGEMVCEETEISTSQLFDLENREFSSEILGKLGLSRENFPKTVKAGHLTGSTKNSKIESLRKYDIKVYSVCGHDTASAVLMTDAFIDKDVLFLSCGTWSLIGAVNGDCIINRESYKRNLTNELGYDSKGMFFKNITGLYLFEKYKEELEEKLGRKIDFMEINEYLLKDHNLYKRIKISDPDFSRDEFDVKDTIDRHLENSDTDGILPDNDFAYFIVIYRSLIDEYIELVRSIEEMTKRKYKAIHMIGGGAKSKYLARNISESLHMPLKAGPYESTALGNIVIQLLEEGEIESLKSGIEFVERYAKVDMYYPL